MATASATLTRPEMAVPVTTVPKPLMVKTRSMGRRKMPVTGLGGTLAARVARVASRFSLPNPVTAEKRHDGGAVQKGALEGLPHFLLHQLQPVRLHQVHLGEDHQALLDPEELADLQVLPGLGHDAFVGGDDQGHQVHAGGAGHHVAHEALVPGHVHDAEVLAGGQCQLGEAQLDGDAPEFFLLEAVRVGPGEGFDQGALAVVNVAGGA